MCHPPAYSGGNCVHGVAAVGQLARLLSTATFVLLAAPVLAQSDAAALFRDGNSLVRSGVYRTALLRYREAAAAGLDTPLLHYNLGVVYYRLSRYSEAATEFQAAAGDPNLAALASYNLGLVRRAAGDDAAAEAAFDMAADRADRRDLRRLAQRAAASVNARAAETETETRPRTRPTLRRREPIGEFHLSANARVGQDDNVYRSPSEPYVDLSDPARPTVVPVPQASSFMPVDLAAGYTLHNEKGDTDFQFLYALDGDFYPAEFSNATRVSQRFSIGADLKLGEREHRRRTLQSAFFVRDHRETNFDPDTGIDREIDGEDLADRFSYVASGMESTFRHRLGRWQWGFDLGFERRSYERVEDVASYGHDYLHGTLSIDYALNEATSLSLGLRKYRRDYDERPAYDLNGDLFTTNPAQRYAYEGVQLGLERRFGRAIELDADLLRLDRRDEFVGYNDYTQDVLRLRAVFRPGSRFRLSLAATARSYDYPRALAFNEPAAGPRELDAATADVTAEFRATRHLSIWAQAMVTDVTSTDARSAYARSQTVLGAQWRR